MQKHVSKAYLIDTDVIINHIHKRKDTLNSVCADENIKLYISSLNKFELYKGAHTSANKDIIDDIIRFFVSIPVDDSIAEKAAELFRIGNLSTLGPVDLTIAATCLLHDFTLVTENKKHFKLIPGLNIY